MGMCHSQLSDSDLNITCVDCSFNYNFSLDMDFEMDLGMEAGGASAMEVDPVGVEGARGARSAVRAGSSSGSSASGGGESDGRLWTPTSVGTAETEVEAEAEAPCASVIGESFFWVADWWCLILNFFSCRWRRDCGHEHGHEHGHELCG